jgi:hypothetical protein
MGIDIDMMKNTLDIQNIILDTTLIVTQIRTRTLLCAKAPAALRLISKLSYLSSHRSRILAPRRSHHEESIGETQLEQGLS